MQDGRLIDFVDGHQKAARGAECRCAVIGDDDANLEAAGPLSFGRSPAEDTAHGINGGAFGRAGAEGEGERLRRTVWIGGAGREGNRFAFADGLVTDGGERRRLIGFEHDGGEGLRDRETAVADNDGNAVRGEELRGGGGPGEESARANARALRSAVS